MSGYSATLRNGEQVVLSVAAMTQSLLLSNTFSFDEPDGPVPLDLSPTEWQLYTAFVTEVSRLEKATNTRFVSGPEFSLQFFQNYSPEEIKTFGKVQRYLVSASLDESLKWFYGAVYSQFSINDIIKAYGATKEEVNDAQNEAKRVLEKEIVQKACAIVPELARWNIKLTE